MISNNFNKNPNKIICKNFTSMPFNMDGWNGDCDECPHCIFNGANASDGCMGGDNGRYIPIDSGIVKPKIGVLNASIITTDGCYNMKTITLKEAKNLIKDYEIDSAIGHKATAEILTTLLNTDIPMNRQMFEHKVGQKCLVFKLNGRIEEGKILSLDELEAVGYSLKILERKS